MSDKKLILLLKSVLVLLTGLVYLCRKITNFPARIPHVSTLFLVLELAKETNSSRTEAGRTTVLNPDGPKNIVRGLRLRSNPGNSL